MNPAEELQQSAYALDQVKALAKRVEENHADLMGSLHLEIKRAERRYLVALAALPAADPA